ncbi:ACT domain-containing protein [Chachezhania antarctica]|uniref:ACT domain-containing protein n=1 Tax=Chachezhania antarctica TaxID=2340860 RepID=UPI000EB15526|nr:ACT domain-containing protein [Chachezhania antarctica]
MTVRDTGAMIAGMSPRLDPGLWHFCTVDPDGPLAPRVKECALSTFIEDEGLSAILPGDDAKALGLAGPLPMRRITLQVNSALDGVGLTAAVAGELARAGIPCNMVAAFHHDHVFVPADRAAEALTRLQARAGASS